MDIGLIGLGNIGVHFGTRLLAAGHNLFVHDKSTKAKNHLAALGAIPCVSAKELASKVEIVFTVSTNATNSCRGCSRSS